MDVIEEVIGCNDYSHIVKGKRTKRQRLLLPPSAAGVATAMTSSSTSGGGGDRSLPSPATSVEFSGSTEEDEDMANCLILLAQGPERDSTKFRSRAEDGAAAERVSSRRFEESATTTNGKAGFYVYECKTCNRSFPSFQALGGHRASHKKPKAMEEKRMVVYEENKISTPSLLLHVGNKPLSYNNKSKIHECSICRSEFSSGQALGGHMRRHRSTVPESNETKKEKNILPLDLNLPAPEDDRDYSESQGTFSFTVTQPLAFVSSALVDCHY